MSICTKITQTCNRLEPLNLVAAGVTTVSSLCAVAAYALDSSGLATIFATTAAIGATALSANTENQLESKKIVDLTFSAIEVTPEVAMLNEKDICKEAGETEVSHEREGLSEPLLIGEQRPPLTFANVQSFECSGGMPYMQDRAIAGELISHNIQFYGVLDGHGPEGAEIAAHVKGYFALTLEKFLPKNPSESDIYCALKKTFKELNLQIADFSYASGTTAAIAVKVQNKVYVANVGDSRILLLKKNGTFEQCTEDAKLKHGIRGEGLTRFGKEVKKNAEKDASFFDRLRGVPLFKAIDMKANRLKTTTGGWGINMASTIGDTICPQALREPKISGPYTLEPGDRLLAATDGVFEPLSSSQVNALAKTNSPAQIGQIAMSVASRLYKNGAAEVDNTSILIATPIPL